MFRGMFGMGAADTRLGGDECPVSDVFKEACCGVWTSFADVSGPALLCFDGSNAVS